MEKSPYQSEPYTNRGMHYQQSESDTNTEKSHQKCEPYTNMGKHYFRLKPYPDMGHHQQLDLQTDIENYLQLSNRKLEDFAKKAEQDYDEAELHFEELKQLLANEKQGCEEAYQEYMIARQQQREAVQQNDKKDHKKAEQRLEAAIDQCIKGDQRVKHVKLLLDLTKTTDKEISQQLSGNIYKDVNGFFGRYFIEPNWTYKIYDIYPQGRAQHSEGRWKDWPEPSVPHSFFTWFMKFQENVLEGYQRKYYTSAHKVLRSSETNRKLDIFLTSMDANSSSGNADSPSSEYDWSEVLVVGKYKQNPLDDGYAKTLIQLAGYVCEVFRSQPDRRYVPGFTICGSIMRLWMFDHAGAYSSNGFDIHKVPEQFIQIIAGYALMTKEELGLNTFIKHNGTDKYIIAQGIKISLENVAISSKPVIVGNGTTCYRGKGPGSTTWDYIVKFAWPFNRREREAKLLTFAKDFDVTNIALLFHHEEVHTIGILNTIANLRRHMEFGDPELLSRNATWFNNDHSDSASEISSIAIDEDQIFDCLVTSPVGRPLKEHKSVKELLQVMCDAIQGHRSLLQDAQILHRNISDCNIIIDKAVDGGDARGMLIDLNVARESYRMKTETHRYIGTVPFLAIEVLEGNTKYSYRHDLESFFYVLIWMCAKRESSVLGYWDKGTNEQIALVKRSYVDRISFSCITSKFNPNYKNVTPLACELRSILFPMVNGVKFVGTFSNADKIYDKIIDSFNRAINGLSEEDKLPMVKEVVKETE